MAQLQRPRPRGARSRHYNNPCRIFVGNISYRIKEPELKDFFSDFGPVMSCEVVRDHIKGWSRGIAFVTFKEAESAQLALDAPEEKLVLEGRIMHTSKPKKPKRQKATQIVNGEEDIHETEEQLGGPKKEPSLHPDVDIRGVELSDDVLHIVFSYLELKDRIRIERVCRQWYRVAKQWWKSAKSLHFQSTFRKFKNDLTDDILHSILKRGCHELRSLDLSASPNRLTNYSLELIGMYCPNLERLDLSGVNATQISFKQLSISCLRLKWLRAHGTHYIGEKCLWWAMHNCNELEYLDLSKNKRISGQCFYVAGDRLHTVLLSESSVTDAGLILLTQHSSRLHCLDVSQCDQLSGGSIRSIAEVRSIPEVDFIEEETMAHGDQLDWHTDRLDQLTRPLDGSYQPIGTGEGVDIYILDTGINYNHEEFEGRAKYSGYDPTDVINNANQRGADCHGHGTHVSSLAGGKTYGAAKKARIYSVRVLNCNNAGPWSGVLNGIDHVSQVIAERGRPAVVSMSLSGSFQRAVTNAVQTLHSEGVVIVVAAGNGFEDACGRTPASSTYAITVGGSANGDGIYSFTNYGRCVDIFAPGSSIRGADHTCVSCSKVISGTSMSTPLVSGVAAIHLQREPRLSPTSVKNRLTSSAFLNRLDFSSIPSNFRSITTNRHLYITGNCGGAFSGSSGSFQSPNYPSNYSSNLHCTWTITASAGGTVQLTFSSFVTESTYDFVNVCEGLICAPGSRWAQLSGQPSQSNLRYSSVGNVLTVEMITDGITAFSGFSATYTTSTSSTDTTTVQPITTTSEPPSGVTPTTQPPTAIVTPQIINNCDVDKEVASRVPILVSEIIRDASTVLQTLISDSLESLLTTRILGQVSSYPATSCKQLADARASDNLDSGYYWVKSSNSTSIQVFCDLKNGFTTSDQGWMRAGYLNMTETGSDCPENLRLIETPKRTCGRGQTSTGIGCSSVFYPTHGISYRKVCGRVTAYQLGTTNAFFAYGYDSRVTIDSYYVDGVSITRGSSPRQHIWTFVAARDEVSSDSHICPCTNSKGATSTSPIPPYVGQNYFCETGTATSARNGVFYPGDPLWDGFGCGSGSSCCSGTNPPYFCVDLGADVTDDIELRVCGNESRDSEDTPVELVELYVR